MTAIRVWEAWCVEPDGSGGREVTDECGHVHETLVDARDEHRLHRFYNVIVGIDYHENGDVEVAREVRHNPRRPKGFGALIFDMVNR